MHTDVAQSESESTPPKRFYDLAYVYWPFAALSVAQIGLLIAFGLILLAGKEQWVDRNILGYTFASLQVLAAFVWIATPIATYRLAAALQSRAALAWTLGGLVPLLSLVAFFVLSSRAQDAFTEAQVRYKPFGTKLPFHATWSRPHLVTLAVVFAVLVMVFGYAVTSALAAQGDPSALAVHVASLVSRTLLPAVMVAFLLFLSYGRPLTAAQSLRLAVYGHANAIIVLVSRVWQRQDFINRYGSAELLEKLIQLELRYLVISIPMVAAIVWLVRRVGSARRLKS